MFPVSFPNATRHGVVPCGEVVGASPSMFPHNARGLEIRVLDGVNPWSIGGFGCGSFCRGQLIWIRGWGLAMGSIPGTSTLVMGNLMGRRFRVGC